MFHKHLDQASKRYKEHPNVAAIYISLPKDNPTRPERALSQANLPIIRDFAYDLHDPETDTQGFISQFFDLGFRSQHRRVHNGDLLSKVGVLSYEKRDKLKDTSVNCKARFPNSLDVDDGPPQPQERSASETTTTASNLDAVSSDHSGTIGTPSLATSATSDSLEKNKNADNDNDNDNRRLRGVRDNKLIVAVAVCMLECMK